MHYSFPKMKIYSYKYKIEWMCLLTPTVYNGLNEVGIVYCLENSWKNGLKFGSLPEIIKMLRGIPVLKPYVNLHLHELDNLKDINEFKIL